jgi:hypothetical protein
LFLSLNDILFIDLKLFILIFDIDGISFIVPNNDIEFLFFLIEFDFNDWISSLEI